MTTAQVRALALAFAAVWLLPLSAGATERARDLALGRSVTASSNTALAPTLTDGSTLPNKNWSTSWSPPQVPGRPSWIAVDLGSESLLERLRVYFSVAAYDGIFDVWAPPRAMQVQVAAEPHRWRNVLAVPAGSLPEHGSCYDERMREYALPPGTRGRYVRLLFTEGGKLQSMSDVVSLSQIRVFGPPINAAPHRTEVLAGRFGEVIVDLEAPQVAALRLRAPAGAISAHSLLAERRPAPRFDELAKDREMWRRGAYTYVTDTAGNRFESVRSRSHTVSVKRGANGQVDAIRFAGIRPTTAQGAAGPLEEEWTLRSGDALTWEITQNWVRDAALTISGTPAFYLTPFGGVGAYRDGRVTLKEPMVTSTLWYDPKHLLSGTHADYKTYPFPIVTEYLTQAVRVRDSWAIYKLFTNFHAPSDLRLAVFGGHLYRRGAIRADFNEIGATIQPAHAFQRRAGEVSTLRLQVGAADKRASGEQLAVSLPDTTLQARLADLFGSVLNGGTISDQKRFHFGNASEDANYAGSSWMQAAALSVATRAREPVSEHPYTADRAFRRHLAQILATLDKEGRIRFGVNSKGLLLDDNLHVISAVHDYVVKTGDAEFAREVMPRLEQMIAFFVARIDARNGLFRSPAQGTHWYYDGIPFSGYNTYYQAFLHRALTSLAELADVVGRKRKVAEWRTRAQALAKAINEVLWYPDAPGGPRYADWIDEKGVRHAYFVDIAQYPLVALGITPPDRARQLLDTADRRLGELVKRHGHTRTASLSLLWPLSPARGERCFGSYFYGGSLLASTYWEILARSRAGRVDGEWGALRLLRNFAERFEQTSFVGSNALDIRGELSPGGDEGYLSDMIVTPAALVHGILGVRQTWGALSAEPVLPVGWDSAAVRIVWKGKLHEVKITRAGATVAKVN